MWNDFKTSRSRDLAPVVPLDTARLWEAQGRSPQTGRKPAAGTAPNAILTAVPAQARPPRFLSVQGLAKRYGTGQPVFESVDFDMAQGEFVCIVGHSGCGKTTLLQVLAGLEPVSAGEMLLDGQPVRGPGLDRGVVFQAHALLPWLNVLDNVAFAVAARWPQWSRAQVAAHAGQFIDMVGLREAARRLPAQLSGGMKQRVGIARAFATQPRMLLLDEPFGALDALTRSSIQDQLLAIVRTTGQTVFMITHDVDEAILLADRILLMRSGAEEGGRHRPGRIAAVVANGLPRNRKRADLHRLPGYDELRGQVLDFLVPANGASHIPDPITTQEKYTHEA